MSNRMGVTAWKYLSETAVGKCLYENNRTGITEGLFEKEGSDQVKELSLTDHIKRAKQGDTASFAWLVNRHKSHIVSVAWGILQNREDAEEVAQDAFVKAYMSLRELTHEEAFYQWLVTIVTRLSINRKKAIARRREEMTELSEQQGERRLAIASEETDRIVTRETVRQALRGLTEEKRTVLILRDLQGFSYEEIAKILELPLGTIKSRIHAARNELKIRLIKEGWNNDM